MPQLPEEGKFKIAAVGPVKTGVGKTSGKPYKVYSLQFDGDQQWYDTFWSDKEDPKVGQELEGKKEYDEKFDSYKFNAKRSGNFAFNPAAAQATVVLGSINLVTSFLSIPEYRKLWEENGKELKATFDKYVDTVKAVNGRVKDMVTSMGSLSAEAKTGEKTSTPPPDGGDPGPQAPPDFSGFPEGDEEVNV